MSPTTIGLLSLFGAAFLYGSQNIATRVAGSTFSPFLSTSMRCLVVVILLSWFVKWKNVAMRDWKWIFLRATGNIVSTTSLFIAINHISVGLALFSFYAGMIVSGGLFGIWLYKEKMTRIKFGSLLITFFGLILLYMNQSHLSINIYFFLAMVGGVGASLWSVFSRPVSSSYSLPQLVVMDNALSSVMAALLSIGYHESWSAIHIGPQLFAIVYLGLTQVFTGQLVAQGFKVVDAQIGTVILLNDPVIGIILSLLIFHESPTFNVLLGGAFILASSIIPAIAEHRKGKKNA